MFRQMKKKSMDAGKIADQALQAPDLIRDLIAGLNAETAAVKYGCEKVLRIIGERRPGLLYPQFALFAGLLDCDNSFLKWGAILTIANLTAADTENRFEPIFDKYFSAIPGPVMITAANTIRGSASIALAKPHLAERICDEVLKVAKGKYKTPECRNIAIGQAIDALDRFPDHIRNSDRVRRFVKKQLANTRAPVRKRAEKFLNRLQ